MPVDELTFPVMGTRAHILVEGLNGAGEQAETRLRELESRWTRFADSELRRLNASGRPVRVSRDTFTLIQRSVEGWRATKGLFDPTVGTQVAALGYDRDFTGLTDDHRPLPSPSPAIGMGDLRLRADSRTVFLPPGVAIDPGAIGKGLAADLVTEELIRAGASGAMVNVGGDLRTRGRAPNGESWSIAIDDPLEPGTDLMRIAIAEGAVATSNRLMRRWHRAGEQISHVIDPFTGACSNSDLIAATAITGDAWWAEVAATATLVAGSGARRRVPHAATVGIDRAGGVHATPSLDGAVV